MRLLFGLFLWAATPFYWLSALGITFTDQAPKFDLVTALVLTGLAVGMAFGEYKRYTDRERAKMAKRAQQDYWLSQRK